MENHEILWIFHEWKYPHKNVIMGESRENPVLNSGQDLNNRWGSIKHWGTESIDLI